MKNIKPLEDRVVVKPIEASEKTAGGIIIPDSAKEKPKKGTVEAIGKKALDVEVGDIVIYGQHTGTSIIVDGDEYLIMKQSEIFAIL